MAAPGQKDSGAFRTRARRWSPVALAMLVVVGPLAFVLPHGSRNPLIETTLWSLLVVVAFAGWGSVVRFAVAREERVDLGLRVIWGASLACAIAGLLTALALMTRAAAFVMVNAGIVLALAALVRERTAVNVRARSLGRFARSQPALAAVSLIVAGFIAIHYLAGISDWHTNPYDDDIAYLSFTKKLLDTGTVLEPFSLRRLSALGGQTFFLELIAVRAAPSQANTFDRSICVLLIVLLITGYRNRARRVPWVVSVGTIAFLLLMPSVAINTASYYSGVAFFLGLFRTLVWLGRHERRSWQNALPVALVGAAACTLRQNYLVVSAAVLAFGFGFRIFASRTTLRARFVEALLAAGFALAVLVPWFIVAWQSNLTFFYPVMVGTANPALQFQSGSSTLLRELNLQIWTLIEGVPLRSLPLFVLGAAVLRERRGDKPLAAYVLGSAVAYVALIHGLTQGEPVNIGRYAFGFLAALEIAVVLVASTTFRMGGPIRREHVALGAVVLGLLAGLVASASDVQKFYHRSTRNIEELSSSAGRSPNIDPPEVALYARLQQSVPNGDRMAVMLDEPYHLDYSRNPIWNLDMPGYSSLPPGIPYFKGSDAVEAYFIGLHVRYLAFVKIGYSRYHYRREYWVQMIFDEQEVWRLHAPYLIDFVDNLTALADRHKHLFDDRGMVVIDLEAPR